MGRLFAVCVLVASGLGQVGPALPEMGYPGARQLCAEHVSGAALHISWVTHATTDAPDVVVARYERTTGRKPTAREDGSRVFKWDASHTTSIYPASSSDTFPHCDEKPTDRERTVILTSVAARP